MIDNAMIDDDALILYHYDDGLTAVERARIETALREDPVLALRYLTLTAELAELHVTREVPSPPQALQRWRTSLERAARLEASAPARSGWRSRFGRTDAASAPAHPVWWSHLGAASAALALLTIGIGIGTRLHVGDEPAPIAVQSVPASSSMLTPLQRGVQAHLRDAQAELVALNAGDAERRSALLAEIIERNRLYERAAQAQNAERLARVLRAFEPVLLSLADERTDSQTFEAERAQLAFELGVMQTKLVHTPSKPVQSL